MHLALFPIQFDRCDGPPILAHNRLYLDLQDFEFFDKLKEVAQPLGQSIDHYDDEGLETIDKDTYDQPLTYVTAHQFMTYYNQHFFASDSMRFRNLCVWDSACIEFVRRLNTTTIRIVLWWH